MKYPILLLILLNLHFGFINKSYGQSKLEFNHQALLDVEFSAAGPLSHYYYNEIHSNHRDPRIGISAINLLGELKWGEQWKFNARLLLERELGQELEQVRIPQLNIQWLAREGNIGITGGRFINPFGSFNQRQLSTQRNFISLPLAYSYYVNVSDRVGFYPGMGDVTKYPINQEVEWGSPILYYGGYATGAMFSWEIKPGKINWKTAIVNGASNASTQLTDPIQLGVISSLKLQPTYFWEQGISLSTGSFMQNSNYAASLEDLSRYKQTLLGTDFKLGSGFFEVSGEIILAFYKVPLFEPEGRNFLDTEGVSLNSIATYLDLKYEPPFIPGSFIAYRIDRLGFMQSDFHGEDWDNPVLRHSLALGYEINDYLLVRTMVSTQKTDQKNWDDQQRLFRIMLTAFY